MKQSILVVGASGATGRLLVRQLLDMGCDTRVIVRNKNTFLQVVGEHECLTIVEGSLLDLTNEQMCELVAGCAGIASCLGHNLTWKGIYGKPRRLVTDAVQRLCAASMANRMSGQIRFVLMNTAGNSNRDLNEKISIGQKLVLGLLRLLLPPHVDNEKASDFLREDIGQSHDHIQWSVVRPDNLLDEEVVTPYEVFPSPVRSAIFNAGQTSRMNVGHFMAELLTSDEIWAEWKGKMPVIYNASSLTD